MTKVTDINLAANKVSDIINSIKLDMASSAPVSNVDLGSGQAKVSNSLINQVNETLTKNQNERG